MPQQQNHNTDDAFPFDWQLDPVHWLLSHEAAPFFEPAQQPGGESFYSDPLPFDLLSPVEATVWAWNPLCMALGHYCPPQPRGITIDVPMCPYAGPAPRGYLDPIVCYGPPFGGPSEVMNGCRDPWPQPEQPGQEYFSPYGPPPPHPPPMPVFFGQPVGFLPGGPPQQPGQEHVYPGGPPAPHHPPMPMPFWQPPPPPSSPTHLPFCPEDMRQPGWFLEGLPTCPNTASAPRTMYWSYSSYGNRREPPESPVTEPEGARRLSSPLNVPHTGATRPGGCGARTRRHSWS